MKTLIGDTPNKDYETFLLETMDLLGEYKEVKSVAVVAFTDREVVTAYHKMCCMDKAYAAVNIQSDYIDDLMMANRDRYLNADSDENE